jgi:hypothetical protein
MFVNNAKTDDSKTYTSSMELSPSWELRSAAQLVRKFLTFYGTHKFIIRKPKSNPYPEPAESSP